MLNNSSKTAEEYHIMAKTIQEQITEMEIRCKKLESLEKLFEKAIKNEFGIQAKQIHKMIENNNSVSTNFTKKIGSYFDLKTDEDFSNFLSIFCTDSSKNYYKKKLDEIQQYSGIETDNSVS